MTNTDLFDAIEAELTTATERALHTWVSAITPMVFPTITAAVDDTTPMNLEAILTATTQWLEIWGKEASPALAAAVAASEATTLTTRAVTLTPSEVEMLENLRSILTDIKASLSAMNLPTDVATTADAVLTLPTWQDTISIYTRNAINKVVGMPESVYRDLIKELTTATDRDLSLFERARIVRNYLNLNDEGTYEKWMIRANRIARTETNNAINLGTLQAAKEEQAITGETLHKAWVATMDSRTRDTHFQLDGKRLPIDGKFSVGGYEAEHPGDQNLPAHECINCRCSIMILGEDEPLPHEADRQTERERSDGTIHSPADEVSRRAGQGVTRARDDEATITAALEGTDPMRRTWSGILAPIGQRTGDDRAIDTDATITSRELPLPLMWQKTTTNGHDTSVIIGKIDGVDIGDGAIRATGIVFDTPEAMEAQALLDDGVIRPSVDLVDAEIRLDFFDTDGNHITEAEWDSNPDAGRIIATITSATLAGATLVATPAFEGTSITLGDPEENQQPTAEDTALVASVMTEETMPCIECFKNPNLTAPTALTVEPDGRVYGHLALWGTEHVGIGRGVTPPHSNTNYALFHVSTLTTDEGPVSVGRLTVGCGHADTRAGMRAAADHYDTVGTTWAFVKAGEDEHGIWVAGIVNPDADSEAITAGASAPLSGDWRNVGGNLELVAALSVNTPGFPVPRAYSTTPETMSALVASGVVHRDQDQDTIKAMVEDAVAERFAARDRDTTAASLAARVLASQVNQK